MVERHILPAARVMTCAAVFAELSFVIILRRMARIAVSGCAFENSINMASRAIDLGV